VLYACALTVFRKMRDTVTHGSAAVPRDENDPRFNTGPYDAPWQPAATVRNTRTEA